MTIYNSRDAAFKTPFGAVKAGEEVCFTLHIPLSYHCQTPYLFLKKEGEEAQKLLLLPAGQQGEAALFRLGITLQEPGLYLYWFDLWVDYRKLYRAQNGTALETTEEGALFSFTVYEADFCTPKGLAGGVMYQIFPDRFFIGQPGKPLTYNERIYRRDKTKEPYFWPTSQAEGYLTQDYFGGDLAGIEQKLGFLRSLGVNWLYLNPIFEAHSNHRYNTADYLTVDPYLGTNEDFERLCAKAKAMGIRIILDGVFSHTGSDSRYFNKESRYPTVGAWQGPQSPYREWYHFLPDGSYQSWWGFDTLPTCNKENPAFRKFICGEGGVVDTWLKRGASGFRLDVADELPDDFIAEIRTAVKRNGEENLLIGEVWEDASTKEAYGVRRRYFLGKELDGVMNYPFRTAILQFLRDADGAAFQNQVISICENYPAPALAACTTHISTHDTVRAITALAGEEVDGHDRFWQSGRRLGPQQYFLGVARLKLAFVLQFTLPGIPCVYYGDEVAMQGYKDPFNRAFYEWGSKEQSLVPLMMQLSALRHGCAAFTGTDIAFLPAENGVLHFERHAGGETCAVAINCSRRPIALLLLGQKTTLPVMGYAWQTTHRKKK